MISVAAEPVFEIWGFSVTNSLVNAWVGLGLFLVVGWLIRRRIALVPKGVVGFFDWLVEFLLQEVQKVTGDRERARRFFPLCGALFFFILLSNWLGLFPGVGSIGFFEMHKGVRELIPLFRPATSDLNFTLAIAALSIIATHIFGILAVGAASHASKFVNVRGIIRAFRKGPVAVLVAVVEFFVGLIEMSSEAAKTLSLALRLFGNVFAGEVLLTVIYSLASLVVPLPFLFLELLVGVIQATVFSMLVLVFLKSMTESHGESEEEGHPSPVHASG